jgi:hypothetical protein
MVVANYLEGGRLSFETLDHTQRIVFARIIDDDQLDVWISLVKNGSQSFLNVLFLIICGQDNCNEWSFQV